MSIINNNTPIGNNQNDNNNSNFLSRVKSFFFKKFKSIKSLFVEKTYVNSKKLQNSVNDIKFELPKETQLHKIIPEHINLVGTVEEVDLHTLQHKPRVDEYGNIIEEPEIKEFVLGKGAYGEVKMVALDSKDEAKNISPLFVKKNFNFRRNIYAMKDATHEHNQNIKYGNYSILDRRKTGIINKYKGETFKNLIKAEFDTSEKYKNSKTLSNEAKESLCHQLLDSVNQFHQQGVLHLDLKPGNILVDAKGKLSIIDLAGVKQNSSKKQNYKKKHRIDTITPIYAAPEVMDDKVTQAYDSWAVGAIIYELYTGKMLTEDCISKSKEGGVFRYDNIAEAAESALSNIMYNKNIPENIKKVLSGLLVEEPKKRATIEQALYQLDHNRLNVDELNDIELGVRHDKIFKKIVDLELQLKVAKENSSSIKDIMEITSLIQKEKFVLGALQQQINQRLKK